MIHKLESAGLGYYAATQQTRDRLGMLLLWIRGWIRACYDNDMRRCADQHDTQMLRYSVLCRFLELKRLIVNFSLSVVLKMNLTNPKNEFFLACGTSSWKVSFLKRF